MENAKAVLKVATRFKNRRLVELQKDVERLQKRMAEIKAMDAAQMVGLFFPFYYYDPTEVLDCSAGAYIGDAEDAAEMLANLTKKPVTFKHNDKNYTFKPKARP